MREEIDAFFVPHRPVPVATISFVAARITRGLFSAFLIVVSDRVFVGFVRSKAYFEVKFLVSLHGVIASAAVFIVVDRHIKFRRKLLTAIFKKAAAGLQIKQLLLGSDIKIYVVADGFTALARFKSIADLALKLFARLFGDQIYRAAHSIRSVKHRAGAFRDYDARQIKRCKSPVIDIAVVRDINGDAVDKDGHSSGVEAANVKGLLGSSAAAFAYLQTGRTISDLRETFDLVFLHIFLVYDDDVRIAFLRAADVFYGLDLS